VSYSRDRSPIAEVGEEESEFGIAERAPMPEFDPQLWVQNINCYVVFNPSPFACRRYG
jgi:hypothetical protein